MTRSSFSRSSRADAEPCALLAAAGPLEPALLALQAVSPRSVTATNLDLSVRMSPMRSVSERQARSEPCGAWRAARAEAQRAKP
jgi:hypothetical protein